MKRRNQRRKKEKKKEKELKESTAGIRALRNDGQTKSDSTNNAKYGADNDGLAG